MTRPDTPAWSSWLRMGGLGALCLGLGIALGAWLPGDDPQLWRQGSVLQQAAGPPPTFADIIDAARPGVVTVRAHFRPATESMTAVAAATSEPPTEASAPGGPRTAEAVSAEDAAVAAAGTAGRDEEAPTAPAMSARNGSGFIVNEKGLVVTSRHVIAGADAIEVIVPASPGVRGGEYRAVLVGEDKATDLAIVRLDECPPNLHALPLGASEDLRAGDWIVAVGNPFGFAQTVTAGVVSFVGRHLPHSDLAVTNDFVQISAPVNPGSSGCPVLDLNGRVVGVTTQAAIEAQGISFAVPSNTLKWTLDAMSRSEDGKVRRGYLGIEFATSPEVDDAGKPRGAVIVRVMKDAPAHRAGIRRGDIIVLVDGEPIADATVLHRHIVQGEPGGHIALQVLRQGQLHDPIDAVLSEMQMATVPVRFP